MTDSIASVICGTLNGEGLGKGDRHGDRFVDLDDGGIALFIDAPPALYVMLMAAL